MNAHGEVPRAQLRAHPGRSAAPALAKRGEKHELPVQHCSPHFLGQYPDIGGYVFVAYSRAATGKFHYWKFESPPLKLSILASRGARTAYLFSAEQNMNIQ